MIQKKLFLVLMAFVFAFTFTQSTAHAWPWDSNDDNEKFTDEDIKSEINSEFYVDPAVSAHLVDVAVTDGIVTLSGSVNSILEKERAVKIVRTIKGVDSVINTIKVKPVKREDVLIENDVEQALEEDPAADEYEIDIAVKDGRVKLTGEVESWAERELAETVVKGVKGVREIENKINVDFTAKRLDTEIKNDIEEKLENDPYIYDGLINVEVDNGEVKLTGTVGSAAEKQLAFTSAMYVNGVKDVDTSGLDVKWWLDDEMKRESKVVLKTSPEIKEAVKSALLYDPRVLSFKIDVAVEKGIVTLSGTVDNLKAKRSAGQDARNTMSVIDVKNLIKVRPETARSDSRIREKIDASLKRNPYIERHEITVNVVSNKAYLYGNVDSDFEKQKAADIVSAVKGVVEVDNNLRVHKDLYSDYEILKNVEKQLKWRSNIDDGDISVEVDDRVVTLSGEVDTWQEYITAVDCAFEGGAIVVESNIDVDGAEFQVYPEYFYYNYYNWYY